MRTPIEPVTETTRPGPGAIEQTERTHPAFALVGINRYQGSTGPMFGSALRTHAGGFTLTVRAAAQVEDGGHVWYFGRGLPLVEINMTASQFAALITTANVGDGTPCTLRMVDGREVPRFPPIPTQGEAAERKTQTAAAGLDADLARVEREVSEVLAKPSVGKADRARILDAIGRVRSQVRSNLPFYVTQVQEAVDAVVAAGKAEVDAWVTMVAQRTGLDALRRLTSGVADDAIEALPAPDAEP